MKIRRIQFVLAAIVAGMIIGALIIGSSDSSPSKPTRSAHAEITNINDMESQMMVPICADAAGSDSVRLKFVATNGGELFRLRGRYVTNTAMRGNRTVTISSHKHCVGYRAPRVSTRKPVWVRVMLVLDGNVADVTSFPVYRPAKHPG